MMRQGNFGGRPGLMGAYRGNQTGNFGQGNFNMNNRNQGNFGRFQNQVGNNFNQQRQNQNQHQHQGNRSFQGRSQNRNDPPRKPVNNTPSKPEESKKKPESKSESKTSAPNTPAVQPKKDQSTPKQTSNAPANTPAKKEEPKSSNTSNSKNTMPSPQPPKHQQKPQQSPSQSKQQEMKPPTTPQRQQQSSKPEQSPQKHSMDVDRPQHQRGDRQQHGQSQRSDRSNYQKKNQASNRSNRERDSSYSRDQSEQNQSQKEEKKFTGRCRLFVGNLTPDVTEDDFKKMFEQYGEVSEAYVNSPRGFGFIRLDYRHNAEAAKAGLDGLQRKGRQLRVRFATHGAALKVKNIHAHASNEMLENAFCQFGDLERAIVIVDDRGKPTGDGIVEFVRKPGAQQALRRINDGIFLLGSSPRPVTVEPLEQRDEDDGMPEKFVNKNDSYKKEREKEPRFAIPGSFEHEFAQRWRQIDDMEKERIERVKKEMDEARVRLEDEMQGALIEYQADQIRKDLMRQQEELRRLEEMRQQDQMRRRQDLEIRQREEERMRAEEDRRLQEMMMGRHGGGPMDQGVPRGRDDMMGGLRDGPRGMKDGAPPLPPPPAPPAGMGLDRSGRPNQVSLPHNRMQGNMGGNFSSSMGGGMGANGSANASGNMGGGMQRQSRFDQQGGNFDGGFQSGGGMGGNMSGGPSNMFGGQGMGGNMGGGNMGGGNMGSNTMGGGSGAGMRGGDRMDRRREGGPRDDYGDIKRRRY